MTSPGRTIERLGLFSMVGAFPVGMATAPWSGQVGLVVEQSELRDRALEVGFGLAGAQFRGGVTDPFMCRQGYADDSGWAASPSICVGDRPDSARCRSMPNRIAKTLVSGSQRRLPARPRATDRW